MLNKFSILILITTSLFAGQFDFYLENDSRLIKPLDPEDRHYTNGARVVYSGEEFLPDFISENLGDWCFGEEGSKRNDSWFIGHHIYTPEYVGDPTLRPFNEMKYAGWLYGGFAMQRTTGNKLEYTEVNLGVIGPSAEAEEVQEWFHELVDTTDPIGWDGQQANYLAVNMTYKIKDRIYSSQNQDLFLEYGFQAGTVCNCLDGIIEWRSGAINGGFGAGRLEMPITSVAEEFFIFVRGGGKLVAYDKFLSGLDQLPVTGYIQPGICLDFKNFRISYAQTFMTKQYDRQVEHDSYATLNVSWKF